MFETPEELRKKAEAFDKAGTAALHEEDWQHERLCAIQAQALRRKAREMEAGVVRDLNWG